MAYEKVQLEIFLIVKPKYLNEPAVGIFKDLSQFLLKYSHILSGFPLSFDIEGVKPTAKVLEDGSLYAYCLVSFCVFGVGKGSILTAYNGYVCNVFPVVVDDNENFSGDFIVKNIEESRIIGSEVKSTIEESESDF